MEEQETSTVGTTDSPYEIAEQNFFKEMDMVTRKDQQAMFYLGRMLNTVEWIQLKKKINKTVIHLVNFNGLDTSRIERLRRDLVNKARQHNQVGKVKFLDGKFGGLFQYNNWNMNPNEALFFLLTGYSFKVSKKESDQQETIEATQESH